MTSATEFLLSLSACSLVFTVILLVLPKTKTSVAVKTAASVFMLSIILKSGGTLIKDLQNDFYTKDDAETETYSENGYISRQTELAVKQVVTEKLKISSCEFSSLSVDAEYSDKEYKSIKVTLEVKNVSDKQKAEAVLSELGLDFTVNISAGE